MQPLDMLKVKFQVATTPPAHLARGTGLLRNNPLWSIYDALRDIQNKRGWRGMYRGVGPNIAGNAASWGLYFWL